MAWQMMAMIGSNQVKLACTSHDLPPGTYVICSSMGAALSCPVALLPNQEGWVHSRRVVELSVPGASVLAHFMPVRCLILGIMGYLLDRPGREAGGSCHEPAGPQPAKHCSTTPPWH
jgi:hypothetical protein